MSTIHEALDEEEQFRPELGYVVALCFDINITANVFTDPEMSTIVW